eukprot:NODE_975_length_2652_cov_0.575793.p2 type:complete len:190 gc:universal NODE_975_length_2652_cov_0.575793:2470-1901(-)
MANASQILLNWPNLVGYVRFLLLLIFLMTDRIEMYMISYLLDAVDGYLARKFNQCTIFGSTLDMIVDRISSSVILLTRLYSPYHLFYVLLDWSSHFIHMQASLLNQSKSHKSMDYGSTILHYYYFNRLILFSVCFGYEMFSILNFIGYKDNGIYLASGIVFYFKHFIHALQLVKAVEAILKLDIKATNK